MSNGSFPSSTLLRLITPYDVQQSLAQFLQRRRKEKKLSRRALAEISCVPAPTIKKFESTGEISLRQFLVLWNCLDDLSRLDDLTKVEEIPAPVSMAEFLRGH